LRVMGWSGEAEAKENSPRRRSGAEQAGMDLTGRVIGAAIAVHRFLGPGLLESAYEECLAYEFEWLGIGYERQVPLTLEYRGRRVGFAYKMDFVVARTLIVELKSVECLHPIHDAQVLTYLRLSGLELALLLNFDAPLLKHGLRRFALSRPVPAPTR